MGFFADKITEVAKLNRMNVDIQSAEKVEESISGTISMIEKIDAIKANEARKSIIGMIETDISKYITDKGEIKLDEFIKNVEHIKQETLNDRKDISDENDKQELFEEKELPKEEKVKENYEEVSIDNDSDLGPKIAERERNANMNKEKAAKGIDTMPEKFGGVDKDNLIVSDLPPDLVEAVNIGKDPERQEEKKSLLIRSVKIMRDNGIEFDLQEEDIEKMTTEELFKVIIEADPTIAFKLIKAKGQEVSIDTLKEMVADFGMDFQEFKEIYTDGVEVDDDNVFKDIFDKTIQIEKIEKAKQILQSKDISSREDLVKILNESNETRGFTDEQIDNIYGAVQRGEINAGLDAMKGKLEFQRKYAIEREKLKKLKEYQAQLKTALPKEQEEIQFTLSSKYEIDFSKETDVLGERISEVTEYLKQNKGIVEEIQRTSNETSFTNTNTLGGMMAYAAENIKESRDWKILADLSKNEKILNDNNSNRYNGYIETYKNEGVYETIKEIKSDYVFSFDMDDYNSLFSSFEQELGIDEQEEEFEEITDSNVAKLNKKITGPASLTKVMAKPKEMVLDYLEMDINSGTDPKNATLVMADMLRDKKLLTKFKGASETGLSLDEYAEIMSGVVMETEQLIEEGKLPETITENGVDRQTSIDDFINMTFDDTEILLSNLPGRISDLSKEEIAALITAKVKEAEQELQQEAPEVEEIQEQESEQKIFTKTISSIFPIEETKKQGIDLSKVGLEDFVEVLDAFASGDKAYLMQVLMKQTTKEMKYLIDNFKNTLGMSNYIEQNGFVPKEVMDKWKQMEAEGKDPFEEMRKAPEEREATVEEAKKQEELAQKLAEQQRQEKQVEEPKKETALIRNEDRSLMQKASAGFKNFFESAKEKVGKFFESVKEKFARKPDEKFGSEVYAMDATKKDKEQENDMWQRVDPREHAEKVAKQQEEKRQAIENGQEKATVNVGEKEER